MHVYDVYMQLRKYASRSKFDVVSNKRKNEAQIWRVNVRTTKYWIANASFKGNPAIKPPIW